MLIALLVIGAFVLAALELWLLWLLGEREDRRRAREPDATDDRSPPSDTGHPREDSSVG